MKCVKGAKILEELFNLTPGQIRNIRATSVAAILVAEDDTFDGTPLDAIGFLETYYTDLEERQFAMLDTMSFLGALNATSIFGTDIEKTFRKLIQSAKEAGFVLSSFTEIDRIAAFIVREWDKEKAARKQQSNNYEKTVSQQNTTQVD